MAGTSSAGSKPLPRRSPTVGDDVEVQHVQPLVHHLGHRQPAELLARDWAIHHLLACAPGPVLANAPRVGLVHAHDEALDAHFLAVLCSRGQGGGRRRNPCVRDFLLGWVTVQACRLRAMTTLFLIAKKRKD